MLYYLTCLLSAWGCLLCVCVSFSSSWSSHIRCAHLSMSSEAKILLIVKSGHLVKVQSGMSILCLKRLKYSYTFLFPFKKIIFRGWYLRDSMPLNAPWNSIGSDFSNLAWLMTSPILPSPGYHSAAQSSCGHDSHLPWICPWSFKASCWVESLSLGVFRHGFRSCLLEQGSK